MASSTVTHDSQSLFLEGRRIWLVSGGIDYFRIPRDLWAERLRAAREAGLNTILVRCPWAVHEPRRGVPDYQGEADVMAFMQMIADAGLMCILRPGPFVGADLDLGGMPSWLLAEDGLALRQGQPAFLEATSRYFRALLNKLQPFSAKNGGPIVLVQCEHEWYCGNQAGADAYLLEISRYIREHGFDLPMINTNNLWQRREETIDTWSGRNQMLSHLRQLRTIHPNSPLMVGDFWLSEHDVWDQARPEAMPPAEAMHRLAQLMAAGAQFNLSPFHGGTNFGFQGGRVSGSLDQFSTTSADGQAPLGEAGTRGELFYKLRRICTFASQFSRVLSGLDSSPSPAVLAVEPELGEKPKSGMSGGMSIVHSRGSQGDVILVFGDHRKTHQSATLLLSDGLQLPVHLGDQPVAWCVLNTHVGRRARLDWTNLNLFAGNGKDILVLFGAAGQKGLLSINYSEIEIEVPKGHQPNIETHEDITLIVCNGSTIDFTHLRDDLVHVGVTGFDAQGEPIAAPGWKSRYTIDATGKVSRQTNPGAPRRRSPIALNKGQWMIASIENYLNGTAPRYATIDGPSTQESCAAGSGYGLVRIALSRGNGKKIKVLAPGIGDRVHFFFDGEPKTLVGCGPGATPGAFEITPPKGKESTLVGLVDNLGRYGGGNDMSEGKGILSHLHEVKLVKIGRMKIIEGEPINPFTYRAYLEGVHTGATTTGHDYVWTFEYRKKAPLIIEITDAQSPALILLNGVPISFYAGRTGRPLMQFITTGEPLRRGKNELRVASLDLPEVCDIPAALRVYSSEGVLTEKATWAFAKWEPPTGARFRKAERFKPADIAGRPIWYRTNFELKSVDHPVWFEPNGLSKGQIFLNGKNIGRYFVATAAGESIPPQNLYYLPEPWLRTDKPNELLIFEEHGCDPSKTKIVFGESAF